MHCLRKSIGDTASNVLSQLPDKTLSRKMCGWAVYRRQKPRNPQNPDKAIAYGLRFKQRLRLVRRGDSAQHCFKSLTVLKKSDVELIPLPATAVGLLKEDGLAPTALRVLAHAA